jgi:iron-sulfur cluster assembly protein
METTITSPVQFTERAVAEIRRLLGNGSVEAGKKLRVGVKGGGCSGMSYVLGFDVQDTTDTVYSEGGVDYLMKPAHALYLMGMEIDWQDGLNARGFTFSNPNASKTCGCGSSFAV